MYTNYIQSFKILASFCTIEPVWESENQIQTYHILSFWRYVLGDERDVALSPLSIMNRLNHTEST